MARKCITLEENTQHLHVKQVDKGCISIDDKIHRLCITNTKLDFKAELGYVSVDNRYAPLPDKPQINYHVLEAGNNTYEYLGVQEIIDDITEQDIDNIIYGG